MKIALVTSYKEKCGISTYSEFLYNELKKEIDVEIISLPFEFKKINFKKYLEIAKSLKKYDVIHIQHEHNLFGKRGICAIPFYNKIKNKNKKIITTIHEIYPFRRNIIGHIRDQIFLRYIALKSDIIIVHTEYSKKYLNEKLQINKNKIFVIPHGLNIIECDKKESRKKLNLPIDKKIIVIPGFIRSNKQYEKIIENSPNSCLIIAAGGTQNEKDEKYFESLKNKIIKTGFLKHDKLEKYICAADIIALYYKNLTMSGVLSIAMGMNKKIITSENDTFLEIQNNYELLFPSNENNLKNNINKILKKEENKSKYINEIEWKEIAKKHIKIYK